MAFRFLTNGQIECDTVDEAVEVASKFGIGKSAVRQASSTNNKPAKRSYKRSAEGAAKHGEAVKKQWAEARELAAEKGIKVTEARKIIAQQSKEPKQIEPAKPAAKKSTTKKSTKKKKSS